jgi:hypothetical protein
MGERIKAQPGARSILLGAQTDSPGTGSMRSNPSTCLQQVDADGNYIAGNIRQYCGTRWFDGAPHFTGMTTILGPNTPSCTGNAWDGSDGILEPSSHHPGGALCLMGDGAVHFFSDNVDTGNVTCPVPDANQGDIDAAQSRCPGQTRFGPSPYGTWGALGSAAGNDTAGDF